MSRIRVRFFGGTRAEIGLDEVQLETDEGSTINDVIGLLIKIYGEKARNALLTKDSSSYKFITFINKQPPRDVRQVRLKDGDSVYLLPPMSGG